MQTIRARALLTVTAFLVAAAVNRAPAAPLAETEADGALITLTTEPCKLAAVMNLRQRALWLEKGRTIEGCFGVRPDLDIVIAYWADRTVTAIPIGAFHQPRSSI